MNYLNIKNHKIYNLQLITMITHSNYQTEINKIGVSNLPETLQKSHNFIERATGSFSNWQTGNATVDNVIKLHLEKVNAIHKVEESKKDKEVKKIIKIVKKEFPNAVVKEIKPKKATNKITKEFENTFPSIKKFELPKNSTKKTTAAKKEKSGTPVENISPEIPFIKSFANLHHKTVPVIKVRNLLQRLQKAILELKIRRTSKYAVEIESIQKGLINFIDKAGNDNEVIPMIKDERRAHLIKIVNTEYKMHEINLLKRFVSLGYKRASEKIKRGANMVSVKDIAQKLLEDIAKFEDQAKKVHYAHQIDTAVKKLKLFIKDGGTLELPEYELNGFAGLSGFSGLKEAIAGGAIGAIVQHWLHHNVLSKEKPQGLNIKVDPKDLKLNGISNRAVKGSRKNQDGTFSVKNYKRKKDWSGHGAHHGGLKGVDGGVMTIDQVLNKNYKLVGISGKFKALLGDISKPTSIFISGRGGSRKTSFFLRFCEHLENLGNRVLYIAGEQYDTPTFKHLLSILKLNVRNDRFHIVPDLSYINNSYDVIVFDSKDSLNIDVAKFRILKKQFPNQIILVTSQGIVTNQGKNWTGEEAWRNEVDTMLVADNGKITIGEKNRWGGTGEFQV